MEGALVARGAVHAPHRELRLDLGFLHPTSLLGAGNQPLLGT